MPLSVKVLSMGERRQFFDDFARAANFDPLSPSNWYSVKLESILEKKVLTILIILLLSTAAFNWCAN